MIFSSSSPIEEVRKPVKIRKICWLKNEEIISKTHAILQATFSKLHDRKIYLIKHIAIYNSRI